MKEDRFKLTKQNLDEIHRIKGTVYTLGLLMGIITRMSNVDYELYREIETRAKQAKDDSWVNTESLLNNSPVLTTGSD